MLQHYNFEQMMGEIYVDSLNSSWKGTYLSFAYFKGK